MGTLCITNTEIQIDNSTIKLYHLCLCFTFPLKFKIALLYWTAVDLVFTFILFCSFLLICLYRWNSPEPAPAELDRQIDRKIDLLGLLIKLFLFLNTFYVKYSSILAQYQKNYLNFWIIFLSKHKKLNYYISFLCHFVRQKSRISYLLISTLSIINPNKEFVPAHDVMIKFRGNIYILLSPSFRNKCRSTWIFH